MQDENIMKMAERADTEIRDVPTLNILLCYLLYKIDHPVSPEQLYDIAIGTGIINYFYYQDSIGYLLKNGLVSAEKDGNGNENYVLDPKGRECAKQLKNYAPKSYRDEKELKIEYEPVGNGYYTHVRCVDTGFDLMDLRLYAPDLTQAKLIGEKILLNPAGFYGKVIEVALSNEEPPYDLSDN